MSSDSTTPSFALFDIAEVLQGRGYPEVAVPFYIDEATALTLSRAEKELTRLALLQRIEEHDELEKKVEEMKNILREQKYTYNLRGIPNKVRQDALAQTYEKYPRPKDPLGLGATDDLHADDRDNFYTTLLWHAMTVSIIAPDGSPQIHPALDTIQNFRDYAPSAALDAIANGIRELTDGVRAGFESVTQDTDF